MADAAGTTAAAGTVRGVDMAAIGAGIATVAMGIAARAAMAGRASYAGLSVAITARFVAAFVDNTEP
jgi:hypothetical protein